MFDSCKTESRSLAKQQMRVGPANEQLRPCKNLCVLVLLVHWKFKFVLAATVGDDNVAALLNSCCNGVITTSLEQMFLWTNKSTRIVVLPCKLKQCFYTWKQSNPQLHIVMRFFFPKRIDKEKASPTSKNNSQKVQAQGESKTFFLHVQTKLFCQL